MKTLKNVICMVLIGLALIAQLISPTRAYADEGKHKHKGGHHHSTPEATEGAAAHPPPHQTAEPTEVPTELVPTETPIATETPTDVVATEPLIATDTPIMETPEPTKAPTEAVATEAPVTADTPTEAPQQSATPDQTTVPPILEQVPTETNVVVLDKNGQSLPLATQDAAAVIAVSDPVWCPAGQAPTPGANGCTISYTTLAALVAADGNTLAADGTIWITAGNVPDASPVTIDGLTYTNWANYGLTLQGGWDGVAGSTTIGSNSVFSGSLTITNWNNGINIQNIDAPSIAISNVTSSSGNGVNVGYDYGTGNMTTSGNVSLDNITVTGATIFGIVAFTNSTITANNITANGNGYHGVLLSAPGNVTMNQILADGNGVDGLVVASDGDITLNHAIASGNVIRGIGLWTSGNVSMNQILADGNGSDGVEVIGDPGPSVITASNITANGNAFAGLSLASQGDIILNQVTMNNNLYGALLVSNGNITVTGTNEFNNNGDRDLEAITNGNITMNNVTATANGASNGSAYVSFFTPSNATINNATISTLDASAVCGTLALNQVSASNISYPVAGEHTVYNPATFQYTTINCIPKIYVNGRLLGEPPQVTPAQYEFDLSCASQTLYPVDLPNGDKVTIVCPVRGRALISRLDNTTIPNDLPAGYTYASAFSVSILQADQPIPVITEGGHVEVSFKVPSQQAGTYSILFWDNGTWVPLSDFLLGPDNKPQTFDLDPGISTDLRRILSGVRVGNKDGVQRVEVSTNFPGVFALAQH